MARATFADLERILGAGNELRSALVRQAGSVAERIFGGLEWTGGDRSIRYSDEFSEAVLSRRVSTTLPSGTQIIFSIQIRKAEEGYEGRFEGHPWRQTGTDEIADDAADALVSKFIRDAGLTPQALLDVHGPTEHWERGPTENRLGRDLLRRIERLL